MADKIQLTDTSWLIKNKTDQNKTGLLFFVDGEYVFCSASKRVAFSDYEHVQKNLGKLKEKDRGETSTTVINGFPVKHADIEIVSNDPPLYKRTNGNVEFMAGYTCVRFNKEWVVRICPKKTTTETYQSVGPFRNRLEATQQCKSLNMRDLNDTL